MDNLVSKDLDNVFSIELAKGHSNNIIKTLWVIFNPAESNKMLFRVRTNKSKDYYDTKNLEMAIEFYNDLKEK